MISVIIPTFNEVSHGRIEKILRTYSKRADVEIICVDSSSTDGTIDIIKKYDVRIINHPTTSRGERLSVGAKAAKNDLIILHHPRSLIDIFAFDYLIENQTDLQWGAFTHEFDYEHPLLKFTSWYSNFVRGDIKGIYYLDHCFYVKKQLLELIDYLPSIDVFEDTILSKRLLKISRPKRLAFKSKTSAVRFLKTGIWHQLILNLWMKILYYLKTDFKVLNKKYEKNFGLNAKY